MSGSGHITVYLSLRIRRVFNADTVAQTFGVQYTINMAWLCPPTENPPDPHEDDGDWTPEWTPKFTVANLVSDGDSGDHFSTKQVDGCLWIIGEMSFNQTIYENMELNSFPADVQDLTLRLTSHLPTSRIRWIPLSDAGFVTLEKIALNDLHSVDKAPFTAQLGHTKDPYDQLERGTLDVHIKVSRGSTYYLFNLYLVLGCICTCVLCSYALHAASVGERLGVDLAVLLTVVAFLLVVSGMVPPVSYVTLMHKYVLCSFVFVIGQTFVHCISPFCSQIAYAEMSPLTLPPLTSATEQRLLDADRVIFIVSVVVWLVFNVGYAIYFRTHKKAIYAAFVGDAKRDQAQYDKELLAIIEKLKEGASGEELCGPGEVKVTRRPPRDSRASIASNV